MKKPIAVMLMILGTIALIYGGASYNRERTVLGVGGTNATATEHKSVLIAPIFGAISLIGGIALLVTSKARCPKIEATPAQAGRRPDGTRLITFRRAL